MAGIGLRRALGMALASLILAIAVAGCGDGAEELPCAQDDACLSYAISADIPILDPHIAELPEAGMVFRQVYDTLVTRQPQTRAFVPGLARSWELSSDGLIYTFALRDDIRFHDGTAFSAASVAANIDRIFDPATASRRALNLLGSFSRYEIIDDFTIRFHLSAPFAPLLDSLSQPFLGIASENALSQYDRLRYQFHQIGSGAFALESYLPGDRILLRRHPGYRADPALHQPLTGAEITRVEFHIEARSEHDAATILEAERDVIDDLAPAVAASLASNSRLRALPSNIPGQPAFLLFNTARPHLEKREVRQALIQATNRVAIANEIYYNFSPVAWAPLSASTGYAHTGFSEVYGYDLSAAADLLAAAGYVDSDGDGVLELNGAPLELTVVAPPWGRWNEVASSLRDSWRRVGARLEIESVPGAGRLLERARAGADDLIAIDNYGLDPAIIGNIFFDASVFSASRAADPRLDELLTQAMGAADPAERRNLYYAIQSHLMTEALLLPIRDYARVRLARSRVEGLRYDAFGFYPLLYNVSLRRE